MRILNGSVDFGGMAKSSAVSAWLRAYLIDLVVAHLEVGQCEPSSTLSILGKYLMRCGAKLLGRGKIRRAMGYDNQ